MYSSTESWTKVVDWKIGVRMAPVVGSGVTPACTCLVRNPMGQLKRVQMDSPDGVYRTRLGRLTPSACGKKCLQALFRMVLKHAIGEADYDHARGSRRVVSKAIP